MEILGSPDDMKLKSRATLIASVLPAGSVFDRLLEKYCVGERDSKAQQLLGIGDRPCGTVRRTNGSTRARW